MALSDKINGILPKSKKKMRNKLFVKMNLGISDTKNLVCPFFYDFYIGR